MSLALSSEDAEVRMYDNDIYRCVGLQPYTRRDGSQTNLVIWETECPRCGEPFTCLTPIDSSKFQPNRRCIRHRRPGQRVRRRKEVA
ncbi:MAG: hypothetical protein NVS2B5_05730 [Beijerinckiaceae bacterium]